MKKILFPLLAVVLLVGLIFTGCSGDKEEEVIELSYGALVSPPHIRAQVDQLWFDRIEEQTNGRVKITPFWGATLISNQECLDEIVKGVAAFGYLEPGASKTGAEVHKGVQGFYYGVGDNHEKVSTYLEMVAEIPESEADILDHVKLLGRHPGANYQLVCTKPVRSIDDFKGLKVKCVGSFQDVIKALGGEGINMPMGESYMGLEKGTIDGLLGPYETLESFNFGEVAKYVINVNLNATPCVARVMNFDVWDSLPKDIQKVFEDNIEWVTEQQIIGDDATNDSGYQIGLSQGVEFIDLPPADLEIFNNTVEQVMRAEAKKLDDKGLPGTKILEKIRSLVD